jgi:hypothetical protein
MSTTKSLGSNFHDRAIASFYAGSMLEGGTRVFCSVGERSMEERLKIVRYADRGRSKRLECCGGKKKIALVQVFDRSRYW